MPTHQQVIETLIQQRDEAVRERDEAWQEGYDTAHRDWRARIEEARQERIALRKELARLTAERDEARRGG